MLHQPAFSECRTGAGKRHDDYQSGGGAARDGDPVPARHIDSELVIQLHRVAYDIKLTQQKMIKAEPAAAPIFMEKGL